MTLQLNIFKYSAKKGYRKTVTMDENWTHDMSIADLKDIVEEKTANLVANQRMFYAGVHLPDVLKLSPDWDPRDKVVLDVIVDKKEEVEAAVMSNLDQDVWIVTGKGTDFDWFPIPAGSSTPKIEMKSKGLIPWMSNITKSVHFLLCMKEGQREAGEKGRWEGKSYTLEGLGSDFTLHLQQENNQEIKIFVEYTEIQEGLSTLSASTEQRKFELKPSGEKKVYFEKTMEARERLIQGIAAGATIVAVPVGIAACCIM